MEETIATRASTGGIGTICTVAGGSTFTVKGYVDSFAGISGSGGYEGVIMRFDYDIHLTIAPRPMVTELGPAGSPYWPDCSDRSESLFTGEFNPWIYVARCHTTGAASTYLGKVVEVDFECTSAGIWPITLQDNQTFLFDSTGAPDNSDKEGDETLSINCLAPVGGVTELIGEATSHGSDSRAVSGHSVAVAIWVASILATSIFAGGVWYARRRWR